MRSGKGECIDVTSLDIRKCYDELMYSETHNDVYDAMITDDKFTLIAKLDEEAKVKVKTPVGMTPEFTIKRSIYQGSVLGPIKCSVSLDTLGRDSLKDNSEQCVVYKYKDAVEVPPLGMMDDVLSVSKCGIKSIEMNATINAKIEGKKLRLNEEKCHKIHVANGKVKNPKCETKLFAHDKEIKQVSELKYLGDVASDSLGFEVTIREREAKAIGIRSQIHSILKGVSLGHFYYQVAFILRESLFINGILTNIETYSPVREKDIKVLMKCDTDLVKSLFNVKSFTYELLYFESGKLPIQFVIAQRRFMYLWQIVTRKRSDLIHKIYQLQQLKPTSGEWAVMMKREKEKYGVSLTDEEISNLSKQQFKQNVNEKVHQFAFSYLLSLGQTHSKSHNIINSLKSKKLETQTYLLTSLLTTSQRQLLFSLRTKSYDVKSNYKKKYEHNMTCRSCNLPGSFEDERHLTQCPTINIDNPNELNIEDIYSKLDDQVKFIKYFEKIHIKRQLLEEL